MNKKKFFVLKIVESYDGYEFRSTHVTTDKSIEAVQNMSEKDLAYYGHEDSGSEVTVDDVKEIDEFEFDTLKDHL